MFQAIEKLKLERGKLTTEYKNNQAEYKGEIKRIDNAIKSFQKGMNELNGRVKTKRLNTATEIEKVLADGAKHLKEIVTELHKRGFTAHYQSISGLMQAYVKKGKKFLKTAPATYALASTVAKAETSPAGQTVDLDDHLLNDEYDF